MRKLLKFLGIGLVLVALFFYVSDYITNQTIKSQIKEVVEINQSLVPDPNNMPVDYNEINRPFLEVNPDYMGWITIKNTTIDLPMVRGSDNEYYLTRNFQTVASKAGAIFMDYRNKADFNDPQVLIYGHHMRNGTMFADLDNYKKQSYLTDRDIITVRTLTETRKYRIFSVFIVDASVTTLDFPTAKDHLVALYENYESRSMYKISTAPAQITQILTLVSCNYDINNGRIIVSAVLITE